MNTVVIASLIAVAAILLAYVLFWPRIVEEPSKPKRRSYYPACGCMYPKLDPNAKPKRFMPPIIQDSDTLILRKFSTSAVQVGDAIHMISKEGSEIITMAEYLARKAEIEAEL